SHSQLRPRRRRFHTLLGLRARSSRLSHLIALLALSAVRLSDRLLRQRNALKRTDDVVGTFFGEETFVIAGAEIPVRAFVIIVPIESPHTARHDHAAHSVVPIIANVVKT